jgi:hypothetical protein
VFFTGKYCHWPLTWAQSLNVPNRFTDKLIILIDGALYLHRVGIGAAWVLLAIGSDNIFLVIHAKLAL